MVVAMVVQSHEPSFVVNSLTNWAACHHLRWIPIHGYLLTIKSHGTSHCSLSLHSSRVQVWKGALVKGWFVWLSRSSQTKVVKVYKTDIDLQSKPIDSKLPVYFWC